MSEAPTVEEREQCLRRCAPELAAKADALRDAGHPKPAAVLDALAGHGERDFHVAGALSVMALEALEPQDRFRAINAVFQVARGMVDGGDDWNPGPLVTWLDEATTLYGFPVSEGMD